MSGAPSLRRLEPARRLPHERRPGVPDDDGWSRPLWSLFEDRAQADPGRCAVVAGDRVLSYGELHEAALVLARRLWAAMPEGLTPLARRLAALIATEIETAAVEPGETFLDQGGDSLSALAVALRVEKVFGVTLRPEDLTDEVPLGEIVAALAARIDDAAG